MIMNDMHECSSIPKNRPQTIRLKSFVGNCWHVISLDQRTCDCEQFQDGQHCEHLNALGISRLRPFTPTVRPTFSQALSALVKSIRIRRIDEAVYWLVYLDTFKEKPYRFRTARRILIGSAEDGHSIPVMEEIVRNFWRNSKVETDLLSLIADAVKICRLPNWWLPNTGGLDYIYHSLVGERAWLYKQWDHRLTTVQREIQRAIEKQDRTAAIGGAIAFNKLQERFGATKQAEFLLEQAQQAGHELAARLCKVHLSAKGALSGDNNFICMSAWMLAGGVSPVAQRIEPVTADECAELMDRARERWRNPKPISRWCCDGIHCAGDDPRFAGLFPQMYAVCLAYQHYGRVDPADEWLPSFRCLDGLIIDTENNSRKADC
jgi:hypothetical protein